MVDGAGNATPTDPRAVPSATDIGTLEIPSREIFNGSRKRTKTPFYKCFIALDYFE